MVYAPLVCPLLVVVVIAGCVGALGLMWMRRRSLGAVGKRGAPETLSRGDHVKQPAKGYASRMSLGPLTEAALRAAGVNDELIGEIKRGEAAWRIALASTAGFGPTLEAARAQSDVKRRLKYFQIVITQTREARKQLDRSKWRSPHKELLANEVGERIARAREYEEALEQRGDAKSILFAAGDPNDWGQVAGASTWSVLAHDFHRAAQIVARSHTQDEPAPTLALLQLCRHSLELEMKTIIDAGRSLVGDTRAIHPTHGLMNCWRDAYPIIQRWWSKEVWDQTAADRVRAIVAAFDEIDSSAMTTRYPVDTSGQVYERPTTLLNFSIKKMMEEYEYAVEFFFSAHLFIEVQRRIQLGEDEQDEVPEDDESPADVG